MKVATDQLTDLSVEVGARHAAAAEICVVVMSVDCEPFILEAVESVLHETPRPEIVVVNTGKLSVRGKLLSVVDDITLVETPTRLFAGGARNLGIRYSRAPVVCFLAADCLATPGWLRSRLAAHGAGHAAVASALRPVAERGKPISRTSWASYCLIHFNRFPETPPEETLRYGLSYDRSLFDRFGWFDEQVSISEDTRFNQRAFPDQKPFWTPDVLTLHRYPRSLWSGMFDQFRRGRRAALISWDAGRKPTQHLWVHTKRLVGIFRACSRGKKLVPREVQRARWLLLPLFAGYSVGVVSVLAYRPAAPRAEGAGTASSDARHR